VADYIAGMTDQYALRLAEEISMSRDKVSNVLNNFELWKGGYNEGD
jgi:hypothetical protein